MPRIAKVHAREILDSRGNPTVETEVHLESKAWGRAGVPSGASTGAYEAHELRDQDPSRFHGKGVLQAVNNVVEVIGPHLKGVEVESQKWLDQQLNDLDGTKNKSKLGANALLGVSLAYAKAAAAEAGQSLYEWVGSGASFRLPTPLMNVLNGGAHADNGLDVQEFMIVPTCETFSASLRAGSEIFQTLKKILGQKKLSTAVGDEGGFAPVLNSNKEAMDLLMIAVEQSGYRPGENVFFALDVAATELVVDGGYKWEGNTITAGELGQIYSQWQGAYPLVSIEDGFGEDDWEAWKSYTKENGSQLQLVGDDLFVTNPERLKKGIDEGAANALLVKVNQIGTLSETIEAVRLAQEASFQTVMSHRSGETSDTTIADLSVGLGCQQIKTGSLCRGERTAKYNQLLRIEEALGSSAEYWGRNAFRGL